jgi:pantetheine-phosphate adenylyltransferase
MKKLKKAAVGGTFDELHRGHKTLIGKAFEVADKVIIGLSSDAFVIKMGKPHLTDSYLERKEELENYLDKSGLNARYEIVPLDDALGRTIAVADGLEALVVSKETKHTAIAINVKRKKAAMSPLKIFTVDMVPADNKSPISTTRIRSGEIDRNGHFLKSVA